MKEPGLRMQGEQQLRGGRHQEEPMSILQV